MGYFHEYSAGSSSPHANQVNLEWHHLKKKFLREKLSKREGWEPFGKHQEGIYIDRERDAREGGWRMGEVQQHLQTLRADSIFKDSGSCVPLTLFCLHFPLHFEPPETRIHACFQLALP